MHSVIFDSIASTYDAEFTATPLGRILRARVQARLALLPREARTLELGCGTGEDAIWLALRGVYVIATDAANTMLAQTRTKAESAGVADLVETHALDLNALSKPHLDPLPVGEGEKFDFAFSNFGALNCVHNLRALADFLVSIIAPHGKLIFVVMNPLCAWEIAAHLTHRDFKNALRRLQHKGALAHIGETPTRVFYPSPRVLARAFAPHFRVVRVEGIGVLLPPSYLTGFASRHPCWVEFAAWVEPYIAPWFPMNHLGDHYLIELETRTPIAA